MIDMKCMSHRTKNRMKPKTAMPCRASSNRAMAVVSGRNQGSRRLEIESTADRPQRVEPIVE